MTEPCESAGAMLRARGTPMTVNEAARTVDVVFSTGARAKNYVPSYGVITEELDMSPNAVRMALLNSGNAPVLDTHRKAGVRDILGRVQSARLERGVGIATIKISDAADVDGVWERIKDGSIRHVSVGYAVRKYDVVRSQGAETVHRAVDWEPYEISLCAVPVDIGAAVRADGGEAEAHVALEPEQEITADASAQDRAADAPASAGDGETDQPMEGRMADNAPQVPEAPALPINRDQIADEVRVVERARVGELRSFIATAQRQAVLPPDRLTALEQAAIEEGIDAGVLRARVMDEVLAAPRAPVPAPRPIQMGASGDDPIAARVAMADALAVGASRSVTPQNERFREFMGMRPSDMLIELAGMRGERVNSRDRRVFLERAMHTSSDFPLLLQDAGNKLLEAGYAILRPTYRQIMAQKSFNDFKPHKFLRLGDFPGLAQISEGGEITSGTISEKREQVTAGTYGKSITVTRQMMVNDELGAFTDFSAMIGERIAAQENALAYAVINTASGAGPTLEEGAAAVFTTGRGNRASSGTTIDVTNLALARAAIMKQTSLDGLPIAIGGRMLLLVGPDRELLARQLTATFVAGTTAATNPYAGAIETVVDPQIAGNRWYMFAEATRPFVYGFVAGQTAPQVRVWNPIPGRDGMTVEVVHDFGVGAVDFRGAYFNPGA